MNGVRTIFKRKGYLLTALSAAVLLAASSGTAYAQITAKVAETATDGDSVTITFTAKVAIEATDLAGSITVTVSTPLDGAGASNELNDVVGNPGTALITFPAGEGDGGETKMVTMTGTAVLQTTEDPDAEDEIVIPTYVIAGVSPFTVPQGQDDADLELVPGKFTIEDDETQTYTLTVDEDAKPKEGGGTFEVILKAMPLHEDDEAIITLQISDPVNYTWDTDDDEMNSLNPIRIGDLLNDQGEETGDNATADENMATITVTTPATDKNRVTDTITLTVYSGSAGNAMMEGSVSVDVEDINPLPAVAVMVTDKDGKAVDPQPTSVEEGTSVYLAAMPVDKDGKAMEAAEELTVTLRPTGTADSADYALVGALTIDAEAMASGSVELEVRADEDVGMESLMFDATVSGEEANGTETSMEESVLSLYIEDGTAKKIEPKAEADAYPAITDAIKAGAGDDEMLNPGETVTIMTSDLFTVMDGYTPSYGVSVEGDSVSGSASGESVTIDAKMAGESKVTVTGTARMAASSFMPEQTVSNVASITFAVMVGDTELVVTVSADPMEIAEGDTSMITATANRYVTAGDGDVEIDLVVVGDGTLDADSIMIAMGEMSGSAMLTAGVDDDMENSTLTVVATGSGLAAPMQVMIDVMDGVEPVPALPLVGQLLLALFMMVGGARLYRRRQG